MLIIVIQENITKWGSIFGFYKEQTDKYLFANGIMWDDVMWVINYFFLSCFLTIYNKSTIL